MLKNVSFALRYHFATQIICALIFFYMELSLKDRIELHATTLLRELKLDNSKWLNISKVSIPIPNFICATLR